MSIPGVLITNFTFTAAEYTLRRIIQTSHHSFCLFNVASCKENNYNSGL